MSRDRARHARVLALTTSDYDGEVLSAASREREMIKAARVTWQQVLEDRNDTGIDVGTYRQLLAENKALRAELARARTTASRESGAWTEPRTTAEKLDIWIGHTEWMTAWEREFVINLAGWRGPLTARQEECLDKLVGRLRRVARARG
jgi:hypothetical protein